MIFCRVVLRVVCPGCIASTCQGFFIWPCLYCEYRQGLLFASNNDLKYWLPVWIASNIAAKYWHVRITPSLYTGFPVDKFTIQENLYNVNRFIKVLTGNPV